MKRIIFTGLFLTICFFAAKAQIYNLSLEESIEIAKKQSYEIQSLLQDKVIAENDLQAALANMKTRVFMNFTLPQFTENVQQWQDSLGISFFPIKTLNGLGRLNIVQPLPTDGTISVSSELSATNDYFRDMRATQLYTSIRLTQSLNSLWGYNDIKSTLKSARLNYERASKALKRSELNLIYSVTASFYDLLFQQKTTEIAKMNLDRLTEAYEISNNKYEAGLIREVENLQNEVDLADAQNTYDLSLLNIKSSTNNFKRLIGLELDAEVSLKSEMSKYSAIQVDPNKAVEMAIANRLEIKESEIQIEMQKILISRQKYQGQPQANLVASWNKIGVSNIGISETFPTSLSGSWENLIARPSNYQVGFTVYIPIIDWGRNKRLVKAAEARLKLNMLTKEDQQRGIEVEVKNLVASLQTNYNRLRQLERSVIVAEKSYGITLQRYTDGDIDSQTLSLERERLNRTRQSHLNAYVKYRLDLADLMRKTFYDFENDVPIE